MFDAQHRCSSAVAAYVPLAHRIFGADCIGNWLKLHFMHSLILSRLLHNTQLWTPLVAPMRKLNGVYMRVLRRIGGDCRFDRPKFTDLEIRIQLKQPSIDCCANDALCMLAVFCPRDTLLSSQCFPFMSKTCGSHGFRPCSRTWSSFMSMPVHGAPITPIRGSIRMSLRSSC